MRYFLICLFFLSILIAASALEWLFRLTGSGLSVLDPSGAGQVSLYGLALLMALGFSAWVARDPPLDLFNLYLRNWKTALRGFLFIFGVAWAAAIAIYFVVGLLGHVEWSQAGWERMGPRTVRNTVVALLVVLVLATTEEILFRAFLMRYLRWNTSAPVTIGAVLFSSLVFATLHNLEDPLAWLTARQFPLWIGLFLLGVLLSVTYIATGSFWCAVAVHAGLLGWQVFMIKTDLLEVAHGPWWLGPPDVRKAPICWLFFVGMALAVYLLRHRLNARFAVERPVVSTAAFPARA